MSEPAGSVLVVSDDDALVERFESWLSECWTVETARGGSQALAATADEPPVVLLDRQLTGIHGDRLLGKIREDGSDSRVAMLTDVEPGLDAMRLGFDDYLVKPVDREHLLKAVTQLFRRAEYERLLGEYYALATRKAELEAGESAGALAADEDYLSVRDDLERVRSDVDDVLHDFRDHDAYVRLCKELSRPMDDGEFDDVQPEV